MFEPPAAKQRVQHVTFVIERLFSQPPARVFAAWSDPKAKAQRFAGTAGNWKPLLSEMDFRVGGRERLRGAWQGGKVSDFDAHYHDIVPDRRIVYSYGMHVGDKRISVSLATIEFEPAGAGTRDLMDKLDAELRRRIAD